MRAISLFLLFALARIALGINPVPPGLLGIGIIFNGFIDDAAFSSALDQGRVAIEETFGRDRVITDYVQGFTAGFDVGTESSPACRAVINDFYEKGYRLVIGPGGYSACLVWAHERYSDLYVLRVGESAAVDLSTNPFANYSRLSTAFVRIWEARYSSGIIAGAYTRTGNICFVVGFRNRLSHRDALALHLGAVSVRPDVRTYFMSAGGFDNATLARIASETLIKTHNCDVIVSRINRPIPSQVASAYNVTSVSTDGDARIVVGESVLSSILYRWDNAFNSAVSRILHKNWTRFTYEGGFADGTLRMAPFGNSYRLNETAKRIVDEKLPWFYDAIRRGTHNGFCNVTQYGLVHEPGSNCLPENAMEYWPYGLVSPPIIDVGEASITITELYISWMDPIAIIFMTISVVFMVTTACLACVTFRFSRLKHPAFEYSSPPFLYLVCFGSIIALMCVFFLGGNRPSDASCNIALWFFAVGLNMSYSAIVVKAGRIWHILRNARRATIVSLPNRQLMIYFVIQLLALLLILVLGTTFTTYTAATVVDKRLPEFSVYVFCQPTKESRWAIALVVYQAVLALTGLWFALKTRHIFDELNESRDLVMISYNILFVGGVFIVLLNILDPTPVVIYAIECTGVIWLSFFTTLVIYFPKMYHVLTGKPYYSDRVNLASSGASGHSRGMSAMSDIQNSTTGHGASALSDAIDLSRIDNL